MFLLAAALVLTPTQEPIERRFDVGTGAPEVYVRNKDGRTELSADGDGQVIVRVTKEVRSARNDEEAQELADEVDVRIEERNGRIEVETRYPERSFRFWRDSRVLVHIEIHAPRETNLDVATEDGPLNVSGFHATAHLRSEDGDVRVTSCSGALDITAEDGDVDVSGFDGEVTAQIEDGELAVEGTVVALHAESEDGTVDVRVKPGSTMKEDWSIRAADGRVRLALPEDFAADLDLRADDGSIQVDRPVTLEGKSSSHELTGKLNEGGHTLRVRTEDGSVRITTG